MHKIIALALFVLVATVSACSSDGGRTEFVDDTAAPSEAAAYVSHPMTEEKVVEAIKENIVAYEIETDAPGEKPGAAEEVSIPMSGESPKDDGTVSPPARATGTLTPTQPGQVLVNGEEEYTANSGLSATFEPFIQPQEDENASFSAAWTALKQKHDPQVKAGMFDCAPLGLADCP